ncbi:MAG: hypothetical protein R2941_13035 [Desulfobacterales bacterium]
MTRFTLPEMLSCYENGWRYRGVLTDLEREELKFVHSLAKRIGSWITRDV